MSKPVGGAAPRGVTERRGMPVVVLDRDGVINRESDAYIKSPDEWQPLAGSIEAVAVLCRAGFAVFVASNQSGLGRGLFTADALAAIDARMTAAIEKRGGRLSGIYYCPHTPEDRCECRKPAPGLLRRIEADHGIDLHGQAVIGDKWSDLEAARTVGARPILVRTGRGEQTLRTHRGAVEEVYADLRTAAQALIRSLS